MAGDYAGTARFSSLESISTLNPEPGNPCQRGQEPHKPLVASSNLAPATFAFKLVVFLAHSLLLR